MRKKFIRVLWIVLLSFIGLFTLGIVGIWTGVIGYMPDMEEMENPVNRLASQIYSADGEMIGTFNYGDNNRVAVGYDDLSPYLVQALVSTEDERFYDHSGIDFIALSRAILKRGIMGNKSEGGGSTITQQLAKQLYSERAHSTFGRLIQKPVEWVIAIKLERKFTKKEIITFYLNQFDFLYNAIGIKSAANTYFNKEPRNLSLNEAATLIGMCQNPSYYNPKRFPERARERRNLVLSRMEKNGYITHADYERCSEEPLNMGSFHRQTHKDGEAPYFREFLRQYMMAKKPEREDYAMYEEKNADFNWAYSRDSALWEQDPLYGWCNKNFKRNGEPYNIYSDGLKIYTTIDSRMQKMGEEALREHLKARQPGFEASVKARYPWVAAKGVPTGKGAENLRRTMRSTKRYRVLKDNGASDEEIERSFNTPVEMTVFSYNGPKEVVMTPMDSIRYYKRFLRAGLMSMEPQTGAVRAYVGGIDFNYFQYDMCTTGRRQVGSTIKPYLYACYFDRNESATPKTVMGAGPVRGCRWVPKGGRGGAMTLLQGLTRSNNGVSHNLIHAVSPRGFWNFLRQRFNIYIPELHVSDPLCLGACEISIADMVAAYTTFANSGTRCMPMYVTRIEDSDGNKLAEFTPIMKEAVNPSVAYKMLVLLKSVVSSGTGRGASGIAPGVEIGGKTGTTNENNDAWFMGFTPGLVCGAWVGGEDRDVRGCIGQGAHTALPLWKGFMKKVYADPKLPYRERAKFDVPKDFDPYDEDTDDDLSIEEVYE